jgi:hypothetical protein
MLTGIPRKHIRASKSREGKSGGALLGLPPLPPPLYILTLMLCLEEALVSMLDILPIPLFSK